jgi:hypothetical protein
LRPVLIKRALSLSLLRETFTKPFVEGPYKKNVFVYSPSPLKKCMSFAHHSYTSTYSIACICIPNLVLSGKKIKRNKLCAIIHYRLNNFVQYFQVLSASNFTATMLTGCLSWCTDQIHGQRLYSILHHLSPVLHDDNVNFHLFFAVAQMSSIIFS